MERRYETVTILGSTGSVGCSTVDLLLAHRDRFQVHCLTGGRNAVVLAQQAIGLGARLAVIADGSQHPALREALSSHPEIRTAAGPAAIVEAASEPVDWTMAAIMGAAGLPSTLAAIRRGGAIAFANKEALVCAGGLMLQAVRDAGATLLPVDSEHNAIFQAMAENNGRASREDHPHGIRRPVPQRDGGRDAGRDAGGRFAAPGMVDGQQDQHRFGDHVQQGPGTDRGRPPVRACRRPRSRVLIHPQSVVHGMVCYSDGSVLAQLGSPDMRIPIAHALAWPERLPDQRRPGSISPRWRGWSFARAGPGSFSRPPTWRGMPCGQGGARPQSSTLPTRSPWTAFLNRRCGFLAIAGIVETVLDRLGSPPAEVARRCHGPGRRRAANGRWSWSRPTARTPGS